MQKHNLNSAHSADCKNKNIEAFELLCNERNIKLTPQRKTVLAIMLKAKKAMSAYDLLDLLKLEEPQAKPPTIYRALDFLLKQGFIHRVESSNSYIICPHFDHPDHLSILFICDCCNQIIETHSNQIETQLISASEQNDFKIKHSIIEIHGNCGKCKLTQSGQ